MKPHMKIVISGSFRKHLAEIGQARENFQKAGAEVLAPLTQEAVHSVGDFVFLATDDLEQSPDVIEEEFMANIRKTDILYVVNIGGYVGQSAATEIGVALMASIPVVVAEKIAYFSGGIPKEAQDLLQKTAYPRIPIGDIGAESLELLTIRNTPRPALSTHDKLLLESLVKKLLHDLKSIA